MNKLTVLIPTRNRPDDLRQALSRLRDGPIGDAPCIVYDDASDDSEVYSFAEADFRDVSLIRGSQRVGPALGRNRLFEHCDTPFGLLMDDDTWVEQVGGLEGLLANDLHHPEFGPVDAVQGQVFRTEDGATMFPEAAAQTLIPFPGGGGCLLRVASFEAIGGFRPFWRYRHEETDLGTRMWGAGQRVLYLSNFRVEHCHTPAERNQFEYDRNSSRNTFLLQFMNRALLPGFTSGGMRALRVALTRSKSFGGIVGVAEGLLDGIRHIGERTPLTGDQFRSLKDLERALAERWDDS